MTDRETFASCVTVLGINECWPWKGKPKFFLDGKFREIARACLLLHGVKLRPNQKVTRICNNPLCTNPRHFLVDGRYIRIVPRLGYLTLRERFEFEIIKTDGCHNWMGPQTIERNGATVNPKVHQAKFYGLNYSAKEITQTCGNKKCLNIDHLRFGGLTVREARKAVGLLPDFTIEERFWQNIRKIPHGCWIWIGSIYTNGEPRLWVDGKYKHANVVCAELLQLKPLPPAGVYGRTCGNQRCIRPEHFRDIRSGYEKFMDHITKRDYGTGYGPCWIWFGPSIGSWGKYAPDWNHGPHRRTPAALSLHFVGQEVPLQSHIQRCCGIKDCICPHHLYVKHRKELE
jgi:hypothetical protein